MMERVEIYVDGACRNNGHNNPQGGCGVYWGPYHPMNWAEKLQGDKQTNNRAELSAAIIGISQAIKLGFRSVQIITDSRYVKEGITKWVHEWKQNDWKTAKKRGDVLNKDLWLWLDNIRLMLDVEWKWVEGHNTEEGNLCADELAKKGITSERGEWQEYGRSIYTEDTSFCITEQQMDMTNSSELITPNTQAISQYTCKKCNAKCTDTDQSIQCQDCKGWIHYVCTRLPAYQLYLYESTQRRFTCEFCTEMDDDFQVKNDYFCRVENGVDIACNNPSVSKGLNSEKINSDKETMTEIIRTIEIATDNPNFSITEELRNGNTQAYLETFKKSTVDLLQESFVSSFDKINCSIREVSSLQPDISTLKQQIRKLSEENERLKLEKSNTRTLSSEDKTCLKCEELSRKITSLNKEHDSGKEKAQQNLHNIRLEQEMKTSKLNADINLLRQKGESLSKMLSIQEADVLTMEKRLDVKNHLILNLEENISRLTLKISELQDTIIETKCQGYSCGEPFQVATKKGKEDTKTTEQANSLGAQNGAEVFNLDNSMTFSDVVSKSSNRQALDSSERTAVRIDKGQSSQTNENKYEHCMDSSEKNQKKRCRY